MHTRRIDQSGRAHDGAGEFNWPPLDGQTGVDAVIDMDSREIMSLPQAAAAAADQFPPAADIDWVAPEPPDALLPPFVPAASAGPWPESPDAEPRRPVTFWAIAGLALLAIIQSAVIGFQLTRQEPARTTPGKPPPPVAARPAAAAPPSITLAPTPALGAAGELLVRSVPAGASVFVNDARRGTAPLTLAELPVGTHTVRVVSGGSSVEQTVTIGPGARTSLIVPISGAPRAGGMNAGWLDIVTPMPVELFENGRYVGSSSQRRLQLPAGGHRLELVNEAVGYRVVESVMVKAGETASLRPVIPEGSLYVNAVPWAEVFVDSRRVGDTPLGNLSVPLGTREIRFRHPDFGEQTRRIVVTAREPARVTVDFRR